VKKNIFTVFIFLFLSNSVSQVENEDFNEFIIEFSENISFQKDRIVFPFIEEYYSDDEGTDTTIFKNSLEWSTHYCLIDTCNGVKSFNYLSFGKENIREIDSVTYSSMLVDAFSNSFWCFKRIHGKWFLVRRISYS